MTSRPVQPSARFDVVAVNLHTRIVRLIATDKTERNADAIVMMAVGRHGVDNEFFSECPHGKYRDGDKWSGHE